MDKRHASDMSNIAYPHCVCHMYDPYMNFHILTSFAPISVRKIDRGYWYPLPCFYHSPSHAFMFSLKYFISGALCVSVCIACIHSCVHVLQQLLPLTAVRVCEQNCLLLSAFWLHLATDFRPEQTLCYYTNCFSIRMSVLLSPLTASLCSKPDISQPHLNASPWMPKQFKVWFMCSVPDKWFLLGKIKMCFCCKAIAGFHGFSFQLVWVCTPVLVVYFFCYHQLCIQPLLRPHTHIYTRAMCCAKCWPSQRWQATSLPRSFVTCKETTRWHGYKGRLIHPVQAKPWEEALMSHRDNLQAL